MLTAQKKVKEVTKSHRRHFPKFREISQMPTSNLTMSIDEIREKNKPILKASHLIWVPIVFFVALAISLII